jgi:hypothetical protein
VGLISGLLTLPLAPVRGTAWLAERIAEQAAAEAGDDESIHTELLELQRLHEAGLIDADELARAEDGLFERLLARENGGPHG